VTGRTEYTCTCANIQRIHHILRENVYSYEFGIYLISTGLYEGQLDLHVELDELNLFIPLSFILKLLFF
jgi:hypothetical protein